MTVNIAIAVAEGLVMAADSMSQVTVNGPAGPQVAISYASAEKLTEISDLPMAAMVNGVGSISSRSIISLIREFEFKHFGYDVQTGAKRVGPDVSVEAITNALATFINERYVAAPWGPQPAVVPGAQQVAWPPALGIIIGGYSPQQFFPEVYQILFPGAAVSRRHPIDSAQPGAASLSYWGWIDALERLLHGFNIGQLDAVHAALEAGQLKFLPGQVPPQPAHCSPSEVLNPIAQFAQMQIVLDGMPLQTAAEFADYLAAVATGFARFSMGSPAVGGEVDVLAIQPEGLAWYHRKPFTAKMARAREGKQQE